MDNSERLNDLFDRGEYGQVVRLTTGSSAIAPEGRLLIAHALALTGHFESAEKLARRDVPDTRAISASARVELILGLIAQGRGELQHATQHFQAAVRLGHQSGNSEWQAWADLFLFRLILSSQTLEKASAALPQVRRSVNQAARPELTAFLHVCVADFEGQSGRPDEAVRHANIASSLLGDRPHVWLHEAIILNRACVATLKCEHKAAVEYVNAGNVLAAKNGDRRRVLMFQTNLANLDLNSGQLDQARRRYAEILKSDEVSPFTLLGAADGLSRVELAAGILDACADALEVIDALVKRDSDFAFNYNVKWSAITKARLFLKRRMVQEALEWLRRVESSYRGSCEPWFAAAMNTVTAQALWAAEDAGGAARELMESSNAGATTHRNLQPQYYFVAASLLQRADPATSNQLLDRARRLWSFFGMPSAEAEIRVPGPEIAPAPRSSAGGRTEAKIVDSLAACIELAFAPELLAEELKNTLALVGCASSIDVGRAPALRQVSSSASHRFALGERGSLSLSCTIPSDPAKAIVLADVLRIARAALDLERFRRDERNRAALWPADPVETEAGNLFLAEEMQALVAIARRIAPTNVPVLITGETGTGKEVLARLIHAYSKRAAATFLPFNCSATPKDMLDSQLFGHRRGAFTGATDSFQGVIRAASGGTLFLDEIGETTLDVQPKLLRFLESSEVHPIGEAQPVRADVRVIAATNADLDTLLSTGRFREDLFYRLNIVRLHVPPLRERRVEIPALANHYLQKYALECSKDRLRLSEETMEYLVLFRWPGNVRQLANEMRRMAALADTGAVLMPEHLSMEIASSRRTIPASERTPDPTEVVVRLDQPMAAAVHHLERSMIQYALKQCDSHMEDTAAMLGLSRKGLYLKRHRFDVESPREPDAPEEREEEREEGSGLQEI